jgi:Ca2+-binding RTX toxin-like protein
MSRWSIIATVVVGVFAMPAVADAATLSTSGGQIRYTAAAGETNNLVISLSGDSYVFTDAGGITITPTAPCTAAANVGSCPAVGVNDLIGFLSDLNDQGRIDPSVVGPLSEAQLSGEDGNDTLIGSDHVFTFLDGDDSTPGNDTLIAGATEGDMTGDGGADTLTGGADSDLMDGGPGNDVVTGGPGNDRLFAENTADGADVLDGGPDTDSYEARGRTVGITVTEDGVANDGENCPGGACEGDNVQVEKVDSGAGNDTLIGGPGADEFQASDGNDSLDGAGGDDSIAGGNGADTATGGDGADVLTGQRGADTIDGGPGDDSINPEFDDEADSYAGGAGIDTLGGVSDSFGLRITLDGNADDGYAAPQPGAALDNVGADIENFSGGPGDDLLVGNDADNEISGLGGADTISAGAGLDTIVGGRGDDNLDAGPGSDSLFGDAGVDLLRSRDSSPDQIDCGAAADTVIADALDSPEASCEAVSDGIAIAKSAKAAGGQVELKLSCPVAEGVACKAKVKLKAKGKTIASGKQKIASGKSKTATLDLNDDGVQALAGPGKLHAEASASFIDAAGETVVTKRTVAVG